MRVVGLSVRRLFSVAPYLALVFGMLLFAPKAHASNIDFFCSALPSPTPCSGSVIPGANFASGPGGISVFNNQGIAGWSGLTLNLVFNTAAGTVSVSNGSATAFGTFSSFTPGVPGATQNLALNGVFWFSLPPVLQAFLNAPQGVDATSITFLTDSTHAVQSVDALITPVPEPTTILLFGSGLLSLAGLMRKRLLQG